MVLKKYKAIKCITILIIKVMYTPGNEKISTIKLLTSFYNKFGSCLEQLYFACV